jgi:hypothetical protein
MKKFILYVIRWQISSPILFICLYFIPTQNILLKTIISNFIGAMIFYWIDKLIFTKKKEEI